MVVGRLKLGYITGNDNDYISFSSNDGLLSHAGIAFHSHKFPYSMKFGTFSRFNPITDKEVKRFGCKAGFYICSSDNEITLFDIAMDNETSKELLKCLNFFFQEPDYNTKNLIEKFFPHYDKVIEEIKSVLEV